MIPDLCITHGLPAQHRDTAIELYWQAFGGHLGPVLGPKPRAQAFLARSLQSDDCICAFLGHDLVGILGFYTNGGSFAGGNAADMRAVYGGLGAAWRLPLLHRLGHAVPDNILMIEGFTVAQRLRGHGIGAGLLQKALHIAAQRGCAGLRLDLASGNTRARKFYERHGFCVLYQRNIGALGHVFGLKSVLHMAHSAAPAQPFSHQTTPAPAPAA